MVDGVDGRPPGAGEQVGGAQEDRCPVVERQLAPAGRRQARRLDRGGHVLVGGLAEPAELVRVIVRLDHVYPVAATHPLDAADGHGEIDWLPGEILELGLECDSLLAARRV